MIISRSDRARPFLFWHASPRPRLFACAIWIGAGIGLVGAGGPTIDAANAAAPEITHTVPAAVTPGETVDLVVHGKHFQQPSQIWTSFPARCEGVSLSSEVNDRAVCRITVPRDEQIGIAAIRVVTTEGVSNPFLIMLDDLPSLSEAGEHSAIENAQQISLPVAVDAVCEAVREDYYQFRARAGQRLSFEVIAQRMGSKLDPVLRLLKMDGSEIAVADDSPGLGGDCRISHQFEADGNYAVALRDVRHEGGANYRYRLRMGSYPMPLVAFPLGAMAGEICTFEVRGLGVDAVRPMNVRMPDGESRQFVELGVPGPDEDGSGLVRVMTGHFPNAVEAEPNNDREHATVVTLPAAINGAIESATDQDFYEIAGKQGDRLYAEVFTRLLGSPCDLMLRVLNKDGAQVAVGSQGRETTLDFTLGDAGPYYLHAEDLLGQGGPEYVYRIELNDARSKFGIAADADRFTAPQGGTFVAKIKATRHGYDGPIDLRVEGLGDDIVIKNQQFKGEETALEVTLPDHLEPGSFHLARVTASATIDDRQWTAGLNQRTVLQAMFPDTIAFPSVLQQTIAVAVGPKFPPFYEFSLPTPTVHFARRVGQGQFDINVKPLNGEFKEAVAFAIDGLPEGIKAEIKPVEESKTHYRVSLSGPTDIAAGQHPLKINATARFKNQTQQVSLEEIPLEIVQPLLVAVELKGPVKIGGTQQAIVRVTRFGDSPQPVEIQWRSGPSGLLVPIRATIPADASEIELELTASAQATPGSYDNLAVEASSTSVDQPVTATSPAATVVIEAADGG